MGKGWSEVGFLVFCMLFSRLNSFFCLPNTKL